MSPTQPKTPPDRVVIVSAEALARAGLAAYFQADPGWEVVAMDVPDQGAVGSISAQAPDLVVWDAGGDEELLDRLGQDLAELPHTLVLVRSAEDAEAAWSAGARAVLHRQVEAETLLAAARAALAGLWISDQPARRQPEPSPAEAEALREALTPRELQVLRLMADGLPNKAISARLSVTESTVKFHVNAILRKLDAQSRTEAVVRAGRSGLIPL
ncbi:MAG: response regulator transcription factor [Anaerolineales bacterium]|nr:response regulator transcription factor [Anaerolineales bacterium]